MLNTLKRVVSGKKEIGKELMGIPMKSNREIWLCPLVSNKAFEKDNQAWIEEENRKEAERLAIEREKYNNRTAFGKWCIDLKKKLLDVY